MILTQEEFDVAYNKAVKGFAKASVSELESEIYGKIGSPNKANRLWLYAYALNTWENTDGAVNYITEKEMLKIVHKIQKNAV